jgi:hypothetical protein
MTKSRTIISIFFLLALGSLTIWLVPHALVRGGSEKATDDSGQLRQAYAVIDEKAAALQGADEVAIRDLVNAVVPFVVGNNEQSGIVGPYQERLVRTEINYIEGQRAGIPEGNVVRVLDELAHALNAPEYARTDEDEVRETRLALSQMIPHLIVPQPLGAGEQSLMGLPYTVRLTMSPVEAVFVTRFLIMQKEVNQFSQITRSERTNIKLKIEKLAEAGFQLTPRQRGEMRVALIEQTLHSEKPQLSPEELATRILQQGERPKNQATAYTLTAISSSRYNEMQDVFRRASTMKLTVALALTNKSLDLLGIED